MARDLWHNRRPVVKVDRINKKITLGSFSQAAFYDNRSIKLTTDATTGQGFTSALTELKDAFTISFWIKSNIVTSDEKTVYINYASSDAFDQVKVSIINADLKISVRVGAVTRIHTASDIIPIDSWANFIITYDSSDILVYRNGILVFSAERAGPLDADSFAVYAGQILSEIDGSEKFRGNIDELRVYNSKFEPYDVQFTWDKLANIDEGNLRLYFPFRDFVTTGPTTANTTKYLGSGITDTQGISTTNLEEDLVNFAPVGFGTSHIILKSTVTLGKSVSLKYPIKNPEGSDLNFGLFVSWVDEDGDFQRREIFKAASGIQIAPIPAAYAGEELTSPFTFEVWSKDGIDLVSLDDDLKINLSDTTLPVDNTDQEEIVAATLTQDTTLAEPYPLANFPLEFNTQQTF